MDELLIERNIVRNSIGQGDYTANNVHAVVGLVRTVVLMLEDGRLFLKLIKTSFLRGRCRYNRAAKGTGKFSIFLQS